MSELWRSFDCLHFFWIPLLPVGTHERWLCTLCNQNPRKIQTRKGFKIAGLIALGLMLVMFSLDRETKERGTIWGARLALAVGFLALLYSTLKKPKISEDERRKGITHLSAANCVYCRGTLVAQPYLHCPTCQIQIYTEERANAVPPLKNKAVDIEAILSNPDVEGSMSGFLATMEDDSLWTNPIAQRVGCLGIVYWRTACDGIETVISENGPPIIRESMALLDELGAHKTSKVWKDVFALFPNGAPPDDYPERESAVELVSEKHKPELDALSDAFGTAVHDDENVLRRLHSYLGRHKSSFNLRSQHEHRPTR